MGISLVDPENPVTQVSKTPSDEEFPWREDVHAEERQQNTSPKAAEAMEDRDRQKQTEGADIAQQVEIENKTGQKEEAPKAGKEQQASSSTPANDERREREEKIISDFKNLAFPKCPKSNIKSELLVKNVKKFIEDMKKKTAPNDLDVRIIPSNMACRFELPIDLRRLKDESPLSYLKNYCKVMDSRQAKYKEKFESYKSELKTVTALDLQNIYESLYHESSLQYEVMHLQRLLVMDLSMELDMEIFIVISCLMERIMLKSRWRGPATEYKKNIFEATNFYALDGKLQDIDISPQMTTLLKYIRGT